VRDGHVTRRRDGGLFIVDPLFADWLRTTFP
jgi:hypothetical protein